MNKINLRDIPDEPWTSPKGKFAGVSKEISVALGRKPLSSDLNERHPFDVELMRIPAGKSPCPLHTHSAQWELYHVVSGTGLVRHATGETPIETGDAFIFRPNEPHQLFNTGAVDLVVYIVANNPFGESCYYPDSKKWLVSSPQRTMMRSPSLDYYDGEE